MDNIRRFNDIMEIYYEVLNSEMKIPEANKATFDKKRSEEDSEWTLMDHETGSTQEPNPQGTHVHATCSEKKRGKTRVELKESRFRFSAESRFTPEKFIGTNRATGIPAGNRVTIIKPPSSSACPSSSVFQVLESINRQFESSSNPVRHKHKRRKHHTNPHHHLAENFLVINDISSATSKHQTQNTEPSPLNGYKTRGLWLRAGGAEHREPPPPESLKSDDSTKKVANHRSRGRLQHDEETTVYQKL
ncbi:hypothetical protein Bca101_029197 [Brassica carinata]